MKMYGEVDVFIHAFLISELVGGGFLPLRSATLLAVRITWYIPERRLGGPQNQSGPSAEWKYFAQRGTRTLTLGRPARS
jgi:hypothetical protein